MCAGNMPLAYTKKSIHNTAVCGCSHHNNPDLISLFPFPPITLADNQVAWCPRGKATATHSQSIQSPPAVTGVSERGGASCWLAEGGVAWTCRVEWRGVAMCRLGVATWRGFMASTLLVWMWKAGATQAPQGQRSPADRNRRSDSAKDSSLNRINPTGGRKQNSNTLVLGWYPLTIMRRRSLMSHSGSKIQVWPKQPT